MTTADAVAQATAVATYRAAARTLQQIAVGLERAGDHESAAADLRLAHAVSVEAVRNAAGSEPDEWERDIERGVE